jgi:hypothetical protein
MTSEQSFYDRDFNDVVLAAEAVRTSQGVVGVVAPLPHQPEWQNYHPTGASMTRLTPSGNSEGCGKCTGTLHVAIVVYQSG